MKYRKKFNEDGTKVVITILSPKGSNFTSNRNWNVEKTYKVLTKEAAYQQVRLHKKLDLQNTYLKNFSLIDIQRKKAGKKIKLELISARRAFFEGIDFSWAQFIGEGDIDFCHAIFGDGVVDFTGADFGDRAVIFESANFRDGDIKFLGTQFAKGVVAFIGVHFGNSLVNFFGAKFIESNLWIESSNFGKGELHLGDTTIKSDVKICNNQVQSINFNRSIIHGTVDLMEPSENMQLLFLEKTKLPGKLYTSSKTLRISKKINNNLDIVNSQIKTNFEDKAHQFRLLKENFRSLGQYEDEDLAYIQFKRNELLHEKQHLQEKWKKSIQRVKKVYPGMPKSIIKLMGLKHSIQYPLWHIKKNVLQDIGHFGTSPWHIAQFMGKTIVGFTLVYYFIFLLNLPMFDHDPGWITGLFHSFYFSVATFFTLSFSELQPGHPFFVFIAGLEGSIGLFLMAYFTVSFVRKVLR